MNTFFDRFREQGNQVFANDNALRRHIDKLEDDVYTLNVHDFQRQSPDQSSLPKSIFKLLSVVDQCGSCDAFTSFTEHQLPVPCRDSRQKLKLIFHRNHLVSVNLHSEVFYDKVFEKFETRINDDDEEPSPTIESAIIALATSTENEEEDAFVQDCDNFSKHYRPNFCSVMADSGDCEDEIMTYENAHTKTCPSARQLPDNLPSLPSESSSPKVDELPSVDYEQLPNADELSSMPQREVNDDVDESNVLKKMNEFKMLLGKFKEEFETFYQWCADSEDHELCKKWSARPSSSFMKSFSEDDIERTAAFSTDTSSTSSSADDSSGSDTDNENYDDNEDDVLEENTDTHSDNIDADTDEPTKPIISGEWFFNLNAARAKLRSYYDNAVSGDWILKLGKAREKFRERFSEYKRKFMKNVRSKETNNKSKSTRWYVPNSEKFKDKFKKFSAKWKSHFTKVKDDFVRSYNQYVPPTWRYDDENRWFFHS